MNCKPGDLAIVIKAESGDDYFGVAMRLCLGRIVRIVKLCDDDVWDFEETIDLGRISFLYCGTRASGDVLVSGMHDRYLCPISGVPIDDEVSEGMEEPAHTSTTRAHAQEAA